MKSPARTLTASDEMRLFWGLAIQPVVATVVSFFVFPLLLLNRESELSDPRRAAIGMAVHVFVLALVLTLVCVLPITVWLVKRRRVPVALSLFLGFAIANSPIALIEIAGGGSSRWLETHTYLSVIGLVCAAAFWLISIRGHDFSRDSE